MRKDNTEFREELVRKHLNDNTVNWVSLVEEYTRETGIEIKARTAADNMKRIAKRIKREQEEGFERRDSIESIADKIILDYPKNLKTERDLLLLHELDPNEFKLRDNNKSNAWGSVEIDKNRNFQSKIDFCKRKPEEITEDILIKTFENVKPIEPIKCIRTNGKTEMLLDLADIHIGAKESRDSRIKQAIESARTIANERKPKSITIAFMGDYLHVANEHETTSKGTQIKTNMTPYEMFDKSFELSRYIIERLSHFPLHIVFIEGNHSRVLEYSLFKGLSALYSSSKHITFDVSHKRRKAVLLGKTLIGFEHGDMNKKNKFDWLQVEHKQLWAKAEYYEIHEGHIHSETVETKGAVIRRTVPTIKEQDQYEYNEGYMKARNAIQLFTYDDKGLRSIEYV